MLQGYGLQVLRFTNQQILNEFQAVCERLGSFIPPNPP
ncbi:MAG: endonuclease domain-containing protein [Aphanothece sp. CMT-3BRIN-NPC111]|nr:endonuclease domain-containing protein [Aphanothece sp. CMT-3BRIN-NPC111]